MADPYRIQVITNLSLDQLSPLLQKSLEEDYTFIQKLWDEYDSGLHRFDSPGATLLGLFEDQQLIAIGGIHMDTYLKTPTVGRLRHIYVLPAYRRQGLGEHLVQALINHGSTVFEAITLRTHTEHGQAFYKALGFLNDPRFEHATHYLIIKNNT